MKKFLSLLIVTLLSYGEAKAELKIKQDSFYCLQDKNRASGEDMGIHNMTREVLGNEWRLDVDGNPTTALLVVFFENMSEADMKDLKISGLSNNKYPEVVEEIKLRESRATRWFFIPESNKTFDINFAHSKLGPLRLTVPKMERDKVYYVTIQASGMTPITISTEPIGATVILDGKRYPLKTNVTIPDITFGSHMLALEYPIKSVGKSMPETRIEVSPNNTSFNYDLMRAKEISLVLSPANAEAQIINSENTVVAHGKSKIKANLKYGTYKIKGQINNEYMETDLIIDDNTPFEKEIRVKPSKSITFRAMQYNREVNASVDIDGVRIGNTPIVYNLPYDKYNVRASYNGFYKYKNIKVDKKSENDILIKFPNRRRTSTWNPFDVDYEPYDWGFGFSYINRCYRWTEKGFSNAYTDFLGMERHNHGIEFNILYQHTFKYGQGLRTGFNLQLMFGEIDVDDESRIHADMTMQIPIEYQFRLPLSSSFSIFAHGGIGLNLGLLSSISLGEDESINVGYGYNEDYDMMLPKRFDCTWIAGGGIQIKHIQLEARFERGLDNNAKLFKKYWDEDITGITWKRQLWTVSMIYIW